jgi:hypothetical protein
MELLTWMWQNTGMQPKTTRPASVTASVAAPSDASDDLTGRREHKAAADLLTVLTAAEKAFPEARDGGKVPPLRDIQRTLTVGQPRAQQVQRHFRALQAAS